MIQLYKTIFIIIISVLSTAAISVNFVFAEPINIDKYGLDETAIKGGLNIGGDRNNPGNISALAGKYIGYILQFVGVIFFILIIWGGVKWMLARGNEGEAGKARDIIVDATIGLIIVMSAYAITSYIGNLLTK